MAEHRSDILEIWRRVHEIFDPADPATEALRVPREHYNPLAEEIAQRLRLPLESQKFVLAGGVGSGKSTELRATAANGIGQKIVILVDLWKHFTMSVRDSSALDHVQPAEVIGLLGLAVYRAGKFSGGENWDRLGKDLADAIAQLHGVRENNGPTLDIAKLAKGLGLSVGALIGGAAGPAGGLLGAGAIGAGLEVLEAQTEAWEWKIGLRGRKKSSDQDSPVRAVLQATNALLDNLRANQRRPVVLFVDGLDRIRENSTFEDLFIESNLLVDLRCDLVVTAQLGFVQRHRARLSSWRSFDFTYVPVASATDPTQPNPVGIHFFQQLAAKRFGQLKLNAPIEADQIARLAYASAGRLRDFMTLVRELAVLAMLNGNAAATDAQVERVIDQLRRAHESGLNAAHIATLQAVLDSSPCTAPPEGEVAPELMDRQLLLAYPNESTWYLPHTVLMIRMLRTGGSKHSA